MSFEVTQNFELVSHEKGKAYPISVKEWEYLKEQIGQIEERGNFWQTIGSILLGAAGTAVLNSFTATFPTPPEGSQSIPKILNWAFFLITGLSGLLAFFFGRSQKKLQKQFAQNVVRQMELIEGRFQKENSIQTVNQRSVRFVAAITLKHFATGKFLASCPKNHNHKGSSNQQMVYAASISDSYSVWMLKGPHGKPEDYNRDKPVNNSDIIRLEHLLTRRNLHSHGDRLSPISPQQEITAWGSNGVCDENDNWRVEIEGGGQLLTGKRLRLIHCNTNIALHSHIASQPEFLDGNQEETGFGDRDNNAFRIVES